MKLGDHNVVKLDTFKVTQTQVSGGAYTMTTDLLIGYTFKDSFNIPLVVKAGIGYGVTRDNIINHNSWSPQYNASATYTVYKGFGVGVRYNKTNTTLLGSNVNIKSSIAYLNIKFYEYD